MRCFAVLVTLALLASACTFSNESTTTDQRPDEDRPTVTSEPATALTSIAPPPPTSVTTTTPAATTTTLARLSALPHVVDEWEWTELLTADTPSAVRYDGEYLAYTFDWGNPLVVTQDGNTILEHTPPGESEWIIQGVELGDQWVAIVENTEYQLARLVVYDLRNGDVVLEQLNEKDADGRLYIPDISISGRYLAVSSQPENPECVPIHDLQRGRQIDEICGDAPISHFELDANTLAFDTRTPGCTTVWTGTLYGLDHNLTSHAHRECRGGSPAAGGRIVVWFESPPEKVGIDPVIGQNPQGEVVDLGFGDNGTLEICWNRAFWLSGGNDVRMWDGGEHVYTIYEGDIHHAYELGCVGPWVTFSTMDAIYTANQLTRSALDACDVAESATPANEGELAAALGEYVHGRFDYLPEDLDVGVSGAVGVDGWWVGHGGFSSHLEGAIFAWSPDGDVGIAWSGNADSEYEIREHMLSVFPEAPAALLGCIDVDGFYS